jgi:hypothetical protein
MTADKGMTLAVERLLDKGWSLGRIYEDATKGFTGDKLRRLQDWFERYKALHTPPVDSNGNAILPRGCGTAHCTCGSYVLMKRWTSMVANTLEHRPALRLPGRCPFNLNGWVRPTGAASDHGLEDAQDVPGVPLSPEKNTGRLWIIGGQRWRIRVG